MPQYRRIGSLSESPWHTWLTCSENQLRRIYEPQPGLFLAESPNVIERALRAGYIPERLLIDDSCLTGQVQAILAQLPDIPVELADSAMMEQLSGYHLTRGVLCAMRRRDPLTADAVCAGAKRIAVLENVVNPTNLGAIFRSAAALGFEGILLTAGCCDPLYRRAVRVSMATVLQIPWSYLPDAPTAAQGIRTLRAKGYRTAAMALRADSLPPDEPRFAACDRLAIVLGTEGEGLADETISACDDTVCIPMMNGVDSLNVAAASAVAFWAMRRTDKTGGVPHGDQTDQSE